MKANIGDIVYFVINNGFNFQPKVNWGVVGDITGNNYVIEMQEIAQKIFIDGVCADKITIPSKWKKLPKDWTYSTKLANIEVKIDPDVLKKVGGIVPFMNDKKGLEEAIRVGLLVPYAPISMITTEIDKNKGWRLTHSLTQNINTIKCGRYYINEKDIYTECEGAQKVVAAHIAECERQANLSEYDWSVEQIDTTLSHWKCLYHDSDEHIAKIREYLLSLPNVEDIEIRVANGNIEWKYWKNKKWGGVPV